MISIFSKPFNVNVLPHKRNLLIVVIVTIFILLLNSVSSMLCVLVLYDEFKECSKIVFAISIIDIVIIILTLIVESVSTYVSDHMCNSYIEVVEKIKNNNIPMNLKSVKIDLLNVSGDGYNKLKIVIKVVKIFSIFICVICIISAIWSTLSTDFILIKLVALILSVLSTFISIYQTFFSTVSCFMIGAYTSALFNMLYEYSKEVAGKYNDAIIQVSQDENIQYI